MVVPVVSKSVDQPLVEETPVPSPLKPVTAADVLIKDITHEEASEAADLPQNNLSKLLPKGVTYTYSIWG